jgi:CubicO group peptidase (beta-lactamase class C family)
MNIATYETLREQAENGDFSGAATLVWRRGRIEHQGAIGRRDVRTGLPVEPDTIFRIASLTKPVTAVAALMLLEQGRFRLDDPITDVLPELAHLQVLRTPDGPLDEVTDAERAISFRDLLTHRAGVSYGDFHLGPIGAAYAEQLGPTIDNALSPDAWVARLATLPLVDQPGAGFHYGHSSDLLGIAIARLEGAPLGAVLAHRLFEPLQMRDTGFGVPAAKHARRAALCGFDAEGHPSTLPTVPGGHALAERPVTMTFESGGQGLWSTANDYLTFARLFVEGGSVDGVAVIRPDTLALMTSNQLTDHQRATARMFGQALFAQGHGYGMGVAVVTDPGHADPLRCRGGVGTVGWPGAYGSWWQADPGDGRVMVFLAHNMVALEQMANGIGLGVWSAIATFHAAATAS